MEVCKICKSKDATKTNSHLLPAFLEAIVGSYDHSYKRDRDILITKTPYETKIHVGAIPSNENERLFNQENLSDERIKSELAKNPCAMDYIFCPDCESALSVYLETPYAQQLRSSNEVEGHIALFFWISVIWRMSIGKNFGFVLPSDIESELGKSIDNYLKAVQSDSDCIDKLIENTPFSYKLFQCKDYCKDPNHGGMIHCWLSESRKSIMCILGDFGIEACFSKSFTSEAPQYFLNEAVIDSAPINLGLDKEQILNVDISLWNATHKSFIEETKHVIMQGHYHFLQKLWEKLKEEGIISHAGDIPPQMVQWIIEKMYSDENVKFGDKFTLERWHTVVTEALEHPEYWNHL
ncbi:MAG: hypothetical protein ACI3YG_00380 [Prevotella sp.]